MVHSMIRFTVTAKISKVIPMSDADCTYTY